MEPLWSCAITTFTVKNIPTDIYDKLKKSAQLNRRSINSEILVCIERAVSSQKIDPESVIRRARTLREKTRLYNVSANEITEVKKTGRL